MATSKDKALAVAKAKFKKSKTKLKGLMEEKETELIAAAIEQVEKTWSEFDDLMNEKIAAGNEEFEEDGVKFEREKDKIISEARKMTRPNIGGTEAIGKTKADKRRNQSRVKWSDISNQEPILNPGKGGQILQIVISHTRFYFTMRIFVMSSSFPCSPTADCSAGHNWGRQELSWQHLAGQRCL